MNLSGGDSLEKYFFLNEHNVNTCHEDFFRKFYQKITNLSKIQNFIKNSKKISGFYQRFKILSKI